MGEAVSQQELGADVLDVNVGLPELDEPAVLAAAVDKLSSTVTLPLVVDSSDPEAVEAAVRGQAAHQQRQRQTGKPGGRASHRETLWVRRNRPCP